MTKKELLKHLKKVSERIEKQYPWEKGLLDQYSKSTRSKPRKVVLPDDYDGY